MKSDTARNLGVLIVSPVALLSLTLLVLTLGRLHVPTGREWESVSSVTHGVINYGMEHEMQFPDQLTDLDSNDFALPAGMSLDMFTYLVPPGSTINIHGYTPLVLFPWKGGSFIGYRDGKVRFKPGGYDRISHNRIEEGVLRGIFWSSLVANALLIVLLRNALRHRYAGREPNKSGEGTA